MSSKLQQLGNKTVTIKAKTKKRFSMVADASLLNLMKTVGRKLQGPAQMRDEDPKTLDGIYLLPTNNILEVYVDPDGKTRGYLFNNLDVWMSYSQTEDAS